MDLRQTWADELTGFTGDDLRDALDAMKLTYLDYPPTLFQFAALCREARDRRLQLTKRLTPPRTEMPPAIRAKLRAFVERGKA